MKSSKLFNQFLKENADLKTLGRKVWNQMGKDADALRELYSVRDARDGYSGFIWYSDTTKFWRAVRRFAIPYMKEEAWSLGESTVIGMCLHFVAFTDRKTNRPTIDEDDLARSLYGRLTTSDDWIDNVLAWYVLEEVANRFQNWIYENDREDDLDHCTD